MRIKSFLAVIAFGAIGVSILLGLGIADLARAQAVDSVFLPLVAVRLDVADIPTPSRAQPSPGPTSTATPGSLPQPTAQVAPNTLSIILTADRTSVPFGEMAAITATFTNGTDEPVTIIEPVDASTYGWRNPEYLWQVSRHDGMTVRPRVIPRCGMMDSLTMEDFRKLAPGSKWSMGPDEPWMAEPQWHWSLTAPGSYAIRLLYRVDRSQEEYVPPDLSALWDATYDGEVVSEPITITVGTPSGAAATRLAGYPSIQNGWRRDDVEALMGAPDHVATPSSASKAYLVYFLIAPGAGDQHVRDYPRDEGHSLPRIVVTLDGVDRVTESLLMP